MGGSEDDDVDDEVAEAAGLLTRFGLTTYQARAYVAAYRLGTGTARQIADLSGVPRERVYDAMNDLHDRGFVDIQHASPRQYRPINAERLLATLDGEWERSIRDASALFQQLEEDQEDEARSDEGVWVVGDRERVLELEQRFIEEASEQVVFGAASQEVLNQETIDAFTNASTTVEVVIDSEDADALPAELVETETVDVVTPPLPWEELPTLDGTVGRILVVDRTTVLVSTVVEPDPGSGSPGEESAVWSRGGGAGDGFVVAITGFMLDRANRRDDEV